MARMLELIREGKAPASILHRAARGELALPAAEAVEILAVLAADRELGGEAEQALRGWDETALCEVASDAATGPEVLRCLLRTQEQRPAVIAATCGNPALALEELESVASGGGMAVLGGMIGSERVRKSARLMELMEQNPAAAPVRSQLRQWLAAAGDGASTASEEEAGADAALHHVLAHHERELMDEEDRPFELVTNPESEADPLAELLVRAKKGETVARPEQQAQLSLLQRIARMNVGARIKLAMRGGREERMILIRDRSRLVAHAVLASPKVDATEMEVFAAMKNVQEGVLRAVAANRKNLKNYGVVRTLVSNPKAPLDVALPLLAHLLIKDLRALAMNKNVNETIRKRAVRMYRMKTEKKKES